MRTLHANQIRNAQLGAAAQIYGSLVPPRYGFVPIERRVNSRLQDFRSLPKVVSVVAAPGYGKSVLLSQLYAAYSAQGIDCVWVGLEERLCDSGKFLTLLEKALGIDVGAQPHEMHDPINARGRTLAAHLNGRLTPLIVFIDAFDAADTDEFTPLLDAIVLRSSPKVRFVMSSARALPITRSRIKLELGLTDIDEADLAFQSGEIADVMSAAGVAGAGSDVLSLVQTRTEGWPAAVRLMQIMMANEGASPALIARFSGSDRTLADLLSRRMLNGFDPDFVAFLLELAQLDCFSVQLAHYALENEKSRWFIGKLTDLHIPVVPLDSSNELFRFHALIQEFLAAEAKRTLRLGRRHRILTRAGEWLEAAGRKSCSLEYALEVGDYAKGARLLDTVAEETVGRRGEFLSYLGWYDAIKGSGEPIGFAAQFWHAWALRFSGQRGAPACDIGSELVTEISRTRGEGLDLALAGRLQISAALFNDDWARVLEDGERWLSAYEASAPPLHVSTVACACAFASFSQESMPEVRRLLALAQSSRALAESDFLDAGIETLRGQVLLEEGDPLEADRVLASACERVGASLGTDANMLLPLRIVRSAVLFEMGRTEEARTMLELGLRHGAARTLPDAMRYCFEAGVSLLPDKSLDGPSVQTLEKIAERYPPRMAVLLGALRVRRLALLGRVDDAIELAKRLAITSFGGSGARTSADASGVEKTLLLLAEFEIGVLRGDLVSLQETLEDEIKAVRAAGRWRTAVDLYLLLFQLHMTAGHRGFALRSVSQALSVAGRRQIMRPFLERDRPLNELLAKARLKDFNLTQPEDVAFLHRLRDALGLEENLGTAGLREDQVEAIEVEPLTPREMELLRCLAGGMTNQQIADRLLLTLPTVKWHLYNLYSKFGVKSRAAALARARGLGFLSR